MCVCLYACTFALFWNPSFSTLHFSPLPHYLHCSLILLPAPLFLSLQILLLVLPHSLPLPPSLPSPRLSYSGPGVSCQVLRDRPTQTPGGDNTVSVLPASKERHPYKQVSPISLFDSRANESNFLLWFMSK